MKKSILLGMPKLTASPEMKKVALEDEPEKVRTYSGYTRIRRKYKCYMNCMVQNGILKVALYLPDHLRLDGDNPAYEVFLDKKKRQFLTYDYSYFRPPSGCRLHVGGRARRLFAQTNHFIAHPIRKLSDMSLVLV